MTIALSIAAASGCANTAQYTAGRLPYNANARGAAAENPFGAGSELAGQQRPSRRAANVPEQPPAMAATTWEQQPIASAPPAGQPPMAAPATAGAAPSATPSAAPPTGMPHQTAYYEQPAAAPAGAPATPPAAASGGIQQMGYTEAAATPDPFAAVQGQSAATGVPIQYTAPPSATAPAAAPPAAASATPAPSNSAPYAWGAETTSMGADEFLPPIQQ